MLSDAMGSVVRRVARHPVLVLLIALFMFAGSAQYTTKHLGINTDTVDMFSPELAFRRNFEQYKQQFPQQVDTLVVVVDAPSPDLARQSADALAQKMHDEGELFHSVYQPQGDPFLASHGLLFLDLENLGQLADRLATAQPFLGRLTKDPTLRGLFGMIRDILTADAAAGEFDLSPILAPIDQAIRSTQQGRIAPMSWQEVLNSGARNDSSSPSRQLIIVQPALDFAAMLPGRPAMNRIRKLAQGLGLDKAHGINVRITGQIAMASEELESVKKSAGAAGFLAIGLVALVLIVALRSIWHVLASLVTLGVGLTMTAAFAAAAVGHLNMISIALGALYVGLGIDYAIHVCLRFQALAATGASKIDRLEITAREIGPSLALCTASTSIGFYAFLPTSFSGVSELGLIAGTGMLISLAVSITVLPALLAVLPEPGASGRGGEGTFRVHRISDWLLNRRRAVKISAGVLGLASLALVTQVRFDENPLDLRDPKSESISTFRDLLASSATPPWSMSILADGPNEADALVRRLKALDEVSKVVTARSFVPDRQPEKLELIDRIALTVGPLLVADTDQRVPQSADEQWAAVQMLHNELGASDKLLPIRNTLMHDLGALLDDLAGMSHSQRAQTLSLLSENILGTLEGNIHRLAASLNASAFTLEDLPDSIRSRWISAGGTWRVEVFPSHDLESSEALHTFVDAVHAVEPVATGTPVVFVESGEAVVGAFREAMLLALIAISVLLLSLLRSVRDVVLVLVPLVLAGALTVAIAVMTNTPFNFANVIALPLLLGIGVDSGIHIVHGARFTGYRGTDIVRSSTSRAVLYSAMTTISGFGALMFWTHRGTASLGRILTIGIVLTLICTLVVLPSLLYSGRNPKREQTEPQPGL